VAGSAASSGGGAAPVLFFAILLGVLAYAAHELRRHRFRLVLAGPVGIVSPQQRPG
jgi:ABC-type enterochelin transport system permease subunit